MPWIDIGHPVEETEEEEIHMMSNIRWIDEVKDPNMPPEYTPSYKTTAPPPTVPQVPTWVWIAGIALLIIGLWYFSEGGS